MITGVRLSELAVGEPILAASWTYKELSGKEAVIKRLEDQFYHASYIGFKYVIDTICPLINSSGKLTMENSGVLGNIWTFEERMAAYRRFSSMTQISVVLEIKFTVQVTEQNVDEYVRFITTELIPQYTWVKYWQIGYLPDKQYTNGTYNCSPKLYAYMMREINKAVKFMDPDLRIGGPGAFESIADYLEDRSGWLAEAIGDRYNESSEFQEIGPNGFLEYISFFSFHGRQDTQQFAYSSYMSVVDNIRTMLYDHLGDNAILLMSTLQGHRANQTDGNALAQQAYYDIREILQAIKCGVVPFKNELVDAYPDINAYGGQYDSSRIDYGLLYWYISAKPAYSTYKYVFDACADFSIVYKDVQVYEANENVDSITFRREEDGSVYTVTVIWPKTYSNEHVVLLPANYLREYQLENGERVTLSESVQVDLKTTKFVVVYEHIELMSLDIDDIAKNIERRLRYQREINDQMMEELPSSFNKEITDTNVYRFMRTVAVELADASMTLDMIKEDLYLDTAREEAIYDNFGVLVKLEKRSDWSYEKYRRLVKGVMSSLLQGPTYQSVVDALQLFTQFKVSIGELYKDSGKYPDIAQQVNPQFAFVVEMEKPIEDDTYSQAELMKDCAYVLKLVKPAHTISILVVILAGSENWKTYYQNKYKIDWHEMDTYGNNLSTSFNEILTEGVFGWKHVGYAGSYYNGVTTNGPLLNNGLLTSPRYVLYDRVEYESSNKYEDDYIGHEEIEDTILSFLDTKTSDIYDREVDEHFVGYDVLEQEPRFGFHGNKYIRLNGGPIQDRILNQYLLGAHTDLKDELTDASIFFKDKYVFSNTLKVIRFSNNYGFSAKFINQNNVITQWHEYLNEHSFRDKVITQDGTTTIVQRMHDATTDNKVDALKENANIKKKTKTEYSSITEFSEIVGVADDPFVQFTNNITPLNRHKLGPNRREKIYIGEFITETYNKANDFLDKTLGLELYDYYNLPVKDKMIEFNPEHFFYDKYDHFINEYNAGSQVIHSSAYTKAKNDRKYVQIKFEKFAIGAAVKEEKYIPKKDTLIFEQYKKHVDTFKTPRASFYTHYAPYLKEEYNIRGSADNPISLNKSNKDNKFLGKNPDRVSAILAISEGKYRDVDENVSMSKDTLLRERFKTPKEATIFASSFDELMHSFLDWSFFNPEYLDKYQFPIYDACTFYREINTQEIFEKPKELPIFASGFLDQYDIYRDEIDALRLNLNRGKFWKQRTERLTFGPEYPDKYQFPIYDACTFYREIRPQETFETPRELPIFETGFYDTFLVHDRAFYEQIQFTRRGGRFFHIHPSLITFGPEYAEKYKTPIDTMALYTHSRSFAERYDYWNDAVSAEMGTFSEYARIGKYNFMLNKATLNNSVFNFVDWDRITCMGPEVMEKYTRPIEERIGQKLYNCYYDKYKFKEDKSIIHLKTISKDQVNWRINDDTQEVIHRHVESKFLEDVPKAEEIDWSLGLDMFDKFFAPVDNTYIDISQHYSDEFHSLHTNDCNLQFNNTLLNRGVLYGIPYEKHSEEVLTYDKYHPITDEDLPLEVAIDETMPTPQTLCETAQDFREHHHIVPNVMNPFRFIISQFNRYKFLRKYVIDDDIINLEHDEEPYVFKDEYMEPETRYFEKFNEVQENANRVYTYSNNERYAGPAEEMSGDRTSSYYKIENYEIHSAVAYLLLEKIHNGKRIVIRKGTYV